MSNNAAREMVGFVIAASLVIGCLMMRDAAIGQARNFAVQYRGPGACSLLSEHDLAALTPTGFTMEPGRETEFSIDATTTIAGRRERSIDVTVRGGSECAIALEGPVDATASLHVRAAVTDDPSWYELVGNGVVRGGQIRSGIDPDVTALFVETTVDGSTICSLKMHLTAHALVRISVTTTGLDCDVALRAATPLSHEVR